MNNLWKDSDAGKTDLEQVVYLSKLIGRDPTLVQPGGGNTSVKTHQTDLLGDRQSVIFVKGSGCDMATMGEEDFPALRLQPLRDLASLDGLSDADMTSALKGAMVDAARPMASVETLAHAFLPHKNIQHTHANAR